MKFTWKMVESAVDEMVKEYNSKGYECSHVYGIPRGGMVLAVMLSHKLNLPILDFMNDEDLEEASKVLLVDDITNTGQTLGVYKESGDIVFTIHRHVQTVVEPDYYVHKKTIEVIYPWETK